MHKAIHIVLALGLVLPLLFGGLLHTVVPHSHSSNPVLVENMHSVLWLEESDSLVTVLSFTSILTATTLVSIVFARIRLQGVLVRAQHSSRRSLHRGTLPYRKFR